MRGAVNAAAVPIAKVAGVAVAWDGLFKLNSIAFSYLAHSPRAHWIFLPAALRVIAVLALGELGAVGLMVGAYLTLPHIQTADFPYELLLSVSSGLAPLVAVGLGQRILMFGADLSGLRGKHIILLSVASALANSIAVNGCMAIADRWHHDVEQIATIFFGDMFGTAIVLTIVSLGLKIWMQGTLKVKKGAS